MASEAVSKVCAKVVPAGVGFGGVGLGSRGWVGCVALGPVTPHWTPSPRVLAGTPSGIQETENNRMKSKLAALRVDIVVPFPLSVAPRTLHPKP